MRSPLWTQPLDEVVANPYDWPSYRLFQEESRLILDALFPLLDRHVLKHHKDERSLDKALWMLLNDALDTLRDCVALMEQQKHRLVGKMFRHLIEVMDLASYFHASTSDSRADLERWFDDEVIPHRRYRNHLERTHGTEKADQSKRDYSNFSRWTHNSYRTLLNSYSLGRDDLLVYDSHSPSILTLPSTLSQYLWALGKFITEYVALLELTGFATRAEIEDAKNVEAVEDEGTSQPL